jgi:hypothetical protein
MRREAQVSWPAYRWAKGVQIAPDGRPIGCREKFLLVMLGDHHREDSGFSSASVAGLAFDIASSERETRYLLRALEDKKLIRTEAVHGKKSRYFLIGMDAAARRPPVSSSRGANRAGVPGQTVPRRGAAVAGDGGKPCPHSFLSFQKKEGEEVAAAAAAAAPKIWKSADVWLQRLLAEGQADFLPNGALDDPEWWDAVSAACSGVDPAFISREFAKMRAYLLEHPDKQIKDAAAAKQFVRAWLCRADEWEKQKKRA